MPKELLAFLAGTAAGLRAMTAPAALSWAAHLGKLRLRNTPLAFLGHRTTTYVLTVLALAELVNDKLPKTPSRKAPLPFAARLLMGAVCGSALAGRKSRAAGLAAGALGAVAGTLGGYELRTRIATAAGGRDLPIALSEDALAVTGALATVL